MLKKLLIALVLLTGSANANFFEALKDAAAKAIEEQNRLNNTVEGNSQVLADQAPTPKFNSLAEEAAYKKKQMLLAEQQKIAKEKQQVSGEMNRQERFKAKEKVILEKYFIKHTDSPEIIESKFKNRAKLFSEMPKDYKELGQLSEYREDVVRFIDVPQDKYLNFGRRNDRGYSGMSEYFSGLLQCQDQDCTNEAFEDYEQYLRVSYETYDSRQAEEKRRNVENAKMLQVEKERKEKADQMQKDQKIKLANEQKARQNVQSACQAWRAKANKGVYSLGVGDKVMSKNGGSYIIQGVNANTFLVNWMGNNMYLQKSDLIPYDSLKTAPSEYCYR